MNSPFAPVVLFRRRLKSVADVLKGIRSRGFTQARWEALLRLWDAVCRHGLCGPICSLHPWDGWAPPDLHGFYMWAFGSLDILNDFTKQVVVSRRETGIRKWTWWLREDLGAWPYAWLWPDFVLRTPFLVVKDPLTRASDILVESHLIGAVLSSVKPGCFFSAWIQTRRGHCHSVQCPSRPAVYLPSRGRALCVGERRWRLSRRRQSPKIASFLFFIFLGLNPWLFFFRVWFFLLLDTAGYACYHDASSVGTLGGHFGRKAGKIL